MSYSSNTSYDTSTVPAGQCAGFGPAKPDYNPQTNQTLGVANLPSPSHAVLTGVPPLSTVSPASSLALWLRAARLTGRLKAGRYRSTGPADSDSVPGTQRLCPRSLTCDVVEHLRVDLRKLALQNVHVRRHDTRPWTLSRHACVNMRQRREFWGMTFSCRFCDVNYKSLQKSQNGKKSVVFLLL